MLLFEVMDKMPPASVHWAWGLAAGGLGYMVSHRWPWGVWPSLLVTACLIWSGAAIYQDPFVGPAVWRESGWAYALHVAGSSAVALILPLVGAWQCRWARVAAR
jgi:hypothetical protein